MYKNLVIAAVAVMAAAGVGRAQEGDNLWEGLTPGWRGPAQDSESGVAWLIELMQNPVDVNKAGVEALAAIPGLQPSAVDSLIGRRSRQPFRSLAELRLFLGVDDALWHWLVRFLALAPPAANPAIEGGLRIRWTLPFERSRGFLEQRFPGHRGKVYQRYRAQRGDDLRFSAVLEKDSGESSYADHWVFSVEKRWDRGRSKVILGDFVVEFGLGLLLAPPFSTGGGGSFRFRARDAGRVLRAYSSALETGHFRGAAAQKVWGHWLFSGWLSRVRLDATRTAAGEIASLVESGMHRTAAEKDHAGSAALAARGGILGRSLPFGFRIEAAVLHTVWSPPLAAADSEPAAWQTSVRRATGWAVHVRNQTGAMTSFAEAAWQGRAPAAVLWGWAWHIRGINVYALGRRYSPRHRNPFARGFGQQSGTRNENGWTVAVTHRPRRGSALSFWFDQYTTPWRTFANPLPQAGSGFSLQWRERFTRDFHVTVRYAASTRREPGFAPGRSVLYQTPVWPATTGKLRLHLRMRLSRDLVMSARMEKSTYVMHPGGSARRGRREGWLVSWDIRGSGRPGGTVLGARLTLFETEDFAARVYQFESGLPGVMRSVALSGAGTRFYIYFRLPVESDLSFSGKYTATSYVDRDVIGSGLDAVAAAAKHELTLQLDWAF